MRINHRFLYLYIFVFFASTLLFAQNNQIAKTDTASAAMVVAAHPYAAKIGIDILSQGGNAVDAAVATAFVIGVVEPHASGLGGGGGMLIYLNQNKEFHYLDYYMQTSLNADTAFSKDNDLFSPRSICIPGTPAGLITAVKKYGNLPLKTVIAPAIKIAREGFIITEKFYGSILDKLEIITYFPQTEKLFFKNEFPVSEGDTLLNPQLAFVLENLAEQGLNYFYKGDFAKKAVSEIQAGGGYITQNDFGAYKVMERKPAYINYHGYEILSSPPPQSGATLLEILNIFENASLQNRNKFDEDASTINLLCESIKRADTDRFYFLGDPATTNIPLSGLLSEKYAKKRFDGIEAGKIQYADSKKIPVIDPWHFDKVEKRETIKKLPEDGPHTTHISVVDKEGNAVSLTQTLGLFFGSGFSSQGVIFNSGMSIFYKKPSPNHIGPGRRPLTTISPSMVMDNGKLSIVIGTPGGGRIFNVLAQILIRMIDFNLTPIEAMEAPRFSTRIYSKWLAVENRFPLNILADLEKMGYNLKKYDALDNYFGGVQMIMFDKALKQYIGISDPRRDGGAYGIDKMDSEK